MSGITSAGFIPKRLPEILESMHTKAKTEFGVTVNLAEDSVLGHLLTIVAAEMADLWEGAQGAYDAAYPSSAEGVSLDRAASLVGITRLPEIKTAVQLRLTGDVNTVIQAGSLFEQAGTAVRFSVPFPFTLDTANMNTATLTVLTVANATAYSVTIGGTTRSYTSDASATEAEIIAGMVSAINTPAMGVTAVNNSNGSFTVSLADVEERTFVKSANLGISKIGRITSADSEFAGPVAADPNTIIIARTPIFGLSVVTNPIAGVQGRLQETDAELRQRRLESVAVTGAGTVDAIRSKIRQLSGVTNAIVVENQTNAVDGDGRPAKSFECVVEGGVDQSIADVIWDSKPAGIQSFGTTPMTVYDAVNAAHTVYFSRPTLVYIHLIVNYSLYNEEIFPSDGVAAIKSAIEKSGSALQIGENVILQRFFGPIYSDVQGIGNLTITAATSNDGITPGAYSANNISISGTQVPMFSVSRITVNLV